MTAAEEWERYVTKLAEDRVFALVALYGEAPDVFEEAFRMPAPPKGLSFLDAGHLLFAFCCRIVAAEWRWEVSFKSDDDATGTEVRVIGGVK